MFFIVSVLLALIVGGTVAFSKRQAGKGSSRFGFGAGPGAAQQSYDADAGDDTAARQALADAVRAGDADRRRGAASHPNRPWRPGTRPRARVARAGGRWQVTVGGQTYTASTRPGTGTPYHYPGGFGGPGGF